MHFLISSNYYVYEHNTFETHSNVMKTIIGKPISKYFILLLSTKLITTQEYLDTRVLGKSDRITLKNEGYIEPLKHAL